MENITISITTEQKNKLEELAISAGMCAKDVVTEVCLGLIGVVKEVKVEIPVEIVEEVVENVTEEEMIAILDEDLEAIVVEVIKETAPVTNVTRKPRKKKQ